jgi:hypothetical protein
MSKREDEARREDARDAAIERSKAIRQFDNDVARHFAEGLSVRQSAEQLGCGADKVQASRTWQTLSTGWAHRGQGKVSGAVRSKVGPALRKLMEARG